MRRHPGPGGADEDEERNEDPTVVQEAVDERRPSPRRRRRRVIAAAFAGVLILGAVGVATGVLPGRAAQQQPAAAFSGATDTITRGSLSGETSVSGTLRYAESRTLRAAFDGVLTHLPASGTVVHQGEMLYRVGDRPAHLLHGSLPAWRDFEAGMSDGQDVGQLESGLAALGHFTGQPDNHFDWLTTNAIVRWQKAQGLPQDGRIGLGTIMFATSDVRIGAAQAQLGDKVGPESALCALTSTTQVVDANVKLANQQLAVVGNKASLHLPGGTTTTGTISAVGAPSEKGGSGDAKDKEHIIPITVTPDDPDALGAFQEASVTVGLPSGRRENVLSVPVGSLLALTPEQFGVEIVESDGTTRKLPVETGMFASGRVEISGEGIKEGQRVVVPQ